MEGELRRDSLARWDRPAHLSLLMEHADLSDHLYAAMREDDLSQVVMMAAQLLKTTNQMPQIQKKSKGREVSDMLRKLGNEALQRKEFQKSLVCYNKALLFAPAGSRQMKLAFSNRSAMLFYLKHFIAALKDIETVFTLGCPEDLVEKLRKRKIECTALLKREKMAEKNFFMQEDFFRFDVERNPEIPCASSYVGVTLESGAPEIVALKDIEVGQVVAVEEAFISENGPKNQLSACHYCHKFDLNLIPCEKCCFALFCGSDCRSKCNEEYHDIECHIMEFLAEISEKYEGFGNSVKAAIRMWKLSKDWSQVITASEEMGRKMIKRSSKNDLCNAKNPFSLLNFDDEKHLNYGMMYNCSWYFALLLHLLSDVPSFLPKTYDEKQNAIRAIARISLGLRLFAPQILIHDSVAMKKTGTFCYFRRFWNIGYFSFASKLKHQCDANLFVVGLNKKIALVATKPIKRGEELTISYIQHVIVKSTVRRQFLYKEFHMVCSCHMCEPREFDNILNEAQMACLREVDVVQTLEDLNGRRTTAGGTKRCIRSICKALREFPDGQNFKEHDLLIEELTKRMALFQFVRTRNMILGRT